MQFKQLINKVYIQFYDMLFLKYIYYDKNKTYILKFYKWDSKIDFYRENFEKIKHLKFIHKKYRNWTVFIVPLVRQWKKYNIK